MLGPTWLKRKFELKLSNKIEKKTKQKQSGNGWGGKLSMT